MDNLVTVEELRNRIYDESAPMIIDVRAPEAYENGHLPGAVNIPDAEIYSILHEVPIHRPLIIYCNMHNPGASSSEHAAEALREAGYHAKAVKGGYREWLDAGLKIVKGRNSNQ
jgi:rhodanese-related sulfurtransferase